MKLQISFLLISLVRVLRPNKNWIPSEEGTTYWISSQLAIIVYQLGVIYYDIAP